MAKLYAHTIPSAGTPIVFLHGVLRNGRCFAPLFPALTPRWSIHSLDLRGHGASESGTRYLVIDYVDDVAAYLRERLDRPAILYGHSLGAMVAARLAWQHPELVSALVLEDPPFHTMGERLGGTPLHEYFRAIQPFVGRGVTTSTLARELGGLDVPGPGGSPVKLSTLRDATSLRFFASCLRHVRPEVIEPIVAGTWLDGYHAMIAARPIECPILLFQSDPDCGGMLTGDDAASFESLASDCTRVFLKGIGHQAHWLGTAAVSRQLVEFLSSLEEQP